MHSYLVKCVQTSSFFNTNNRVVTFLNTFLIPTWMKLRINYTWSPQIADCVKIWVVSMVLSTSSVDCFKLQPPTKANVLECNTKAESSSRGNIQTSHRKVFTSKNQTGTLLHRVNSANHHNTALDGLSTTGLCMMYLTF